MRQSPRQIKGLLTALFCLFLVIQCGEEKIAGTGSETGNSLTGSVTTSASVKKEGILISIYSTGYKPHIPEGFADTTLTNGNGEFYFDSLKSGKLNLVALDTISDEGIFIPNLEITDKQPTQVGIKLLRPLGSLSGILKDTTGRLISSPTIFSIGSPFFSVADSLGKFEIKKLPPSSYDWILGYQFKSGTGTISKIDSAQDTLPGIEILEGKPTNLNTVILSIN